MDDQHLQIIEANIEPQAKISQLFMLCEHLFRVLDETEESQSDLRFLESVCKQMKELGYKLKVDEFTDEFKATFWRGKGDGVETYSHTAPTLIEAIELAGNKPNAEEIIAKIRKWQEEMEQTT